MELGIKIGPDNWREKLTNDLDIRCVEVYFDLRRLDEYAPLFEHLRANGIVAGLHASTMLADGTVPNLATADERVRRDSASLLRHTVDIAAEHGARFVVIHPGSRRVQRVARGMVVVDGTATKSTLARQLMAEEVTRLAACGRKVGVEVWPENLPGHECASYEPFDRERAVDVGFVPWQSLADLGRRDVGLCLDLGHLYAEVMLRERPGAVAWAMVMAATRELSPFVRHLHLSTIAPPWNGTDSHHGFLATDYAQGAVPDRDQVLEWLRTFAGRELCVIPEPAGGAMAHLANYRQLSKWMEGLI